MEVGRAPDLGPDRNPLVRALELRADLACREVFEVPNFAGSEPKEEAKREQFPEHRVHSDRVSASVILVSPESECLSEADRESFALLTRSCAQFAIRWAAFAVRGADALEWLHGQVSNDVRSLAVGETVEACFLDATGHVQAPALVGRFSDRAVVLVPAETTSVLSGRVEKTVFLEDVTLEPIDAAVVALYGPLGRASVSAKAGKDLSQAGHLESGGIVLGRPGGGREWFLVGAAAGEIPFATAAAVEAFRIELGIPAWGRDFGPKTLLPEMGPDFTERNVSYVKGCYLGQEVVMRIRSRGHTNRTWVGLLAERPMAAGSVVHSVAREDAGLVTSVAVSPDRGPVGAAMLANAAAKPDSKVTVESAEGTISAKVATLPLRDAV